MNIYELMWGKSVLNFATVNKATSLWAADEKEVAFRLFTVRYIRVYDSKTFKNLITWSLLMVRVQYIQVVLWL